MSIHLTKYLSLAVDLFRLKKSLCATNDGRAKYFFFCSYFFLIFFLGNPYSAIANGDISFERGKKTVDSLLQLTPEFEPFQKEEEGLYAISLAQKIGYKIGEAKALIKLGENYWRKYDEEKTFEHLNRAKEILDEHGTSREQLMGILALAEANRYIGNLKEALDFGESTIKLAEQTDDSLFFGKGTWVKAMAHLHLHQNDKYFEYGEKALAVFKKIKSAPEMVEAYVRLGCIDGDYIKRFAYFSEAEKLLPEIENKRLRKLKKQLLYSYIAIAYLDKKNYSAAEEPTKITLEIAKEIGDVNMQNIMHNYLAKINFHHYGNYEKAIEYEELHLDYEKSIGRYWYVIPAAQFLMEIYNDAGQPEKALEFAGVAMLYQDSLYWANRKDDVGDLEKAYELKKKYAEVQLLETQRRTRTVIGVGGTLFFLLLAGFFYRQRQLKNRHLKIQEKLNRQLQKDKATIEKQKRQLARINASKNQLFAIIAHDMRNAVYNFRGVTDKIHYFIKRNQPERIDEFGDQIEMSVNNLTGLMNNLLTWAMAQKDAIPYQPENIEVKEMAEHVFKNFADRAERKNIQLRIDVPENSQVHADRNALSTILRNLVGNSIKYTEQGNIYISSVQKNGSTKITLKDDGIGMDENQLEKLFHINKNKTRRGTSGEKGSGIGMMLVKELVEMNRGEIKVESELGKGTLTIVELPSDDT